MALPWTSVGVLTGGQVLGFHTSGKHLAKWSTIYYNASIDLCIQLNTIGLLQPLSLASRFMPIVNNCKALVPCTYHNTLTLWYNLTSLGICQPTSVSQKRDAQEDCTMMWSKHSYFLLSIDMLLSSSKLDLHMGGHWNQLINSAHHTHNIDVDMLISVNINTQIQKDRWVPSSNHEFNQQFQICKLLPSSWDNRLIPDSVLSLKQLETKLSCNSSEQRTGTVTDYLLKFWWTRLTWRHLHSFPHGKKTQEKFKYLMVNKECEH
jgi:hypothetical protein